MASRRIRPANANTGAGTHCFSCGLAGNPGAREEIKPATAKLTSAERQRIQEWVEKQLPNLQGQIPNLSEKLWHIVQSSIGGFLGATGFLLSLILVPIYLFFLLKEGPNIGRRWLASTAPRRWNERVRFQFPSDRARRELPIN